MNGGSCGPALVVSPEVVRLFFNEEAVLDR
jgi:hypothetical protein